VTPVNATGEPVVFDKITPAVTDEPTLVVGNVRTVGLADTLPATPVPCRGITCVVVAALSVIVKVPVRPLVPEACDGVNVIGMVQDWPAVTKKQFEPLEAIAKSFPLICRLVIWSAAVAEAELEMVMVIDWLWVFTVWAGKINGFGEIVICAAGIEAFTTTMIGV
jgi:hypothetical protein